MLSSILPRKNLANHPQLAPSTNAQVREVPRKVEGMAQRWLMNGFTVLGDIRCKLLPILPILQWAFWNHELLF